MLISEEELENLERYAEGQERISSRSLRTVLENAFADREPRQNPSEHEEIHENLPDNLKLTQEDFLAGARDLGIEVNDIEDPNFEVLKSALIPSRNLWIQLYKVLVDFYPARTTVEDTLLPQFKTPFVKLCLAATFDKAFGNEIVGIRVPATLRRLLPLVRVRSEALQTVLKIMEEGGRGSPALMLDSCKLGAPYILGRLCGAPLEASENLAFPVMWGSHRASFTELLRITADFWDKFEWLSDLDSYLLDPDKEEERIVTDKTLLICNTLFGRGSFLEWYVAAGYSGIQRLVPMFDAIISNPEVSHAARVGGHENAGSDLLFLSLLKMPARQLKGYSKKLNARMQRSLKQARSLGRVISFTILSEGALDYAYGDDVSEFRTFQIPMALTRLANSVSGNAGEYISFAAELRQKNGGSLRVDPKLLEVLGLDRYTTEQVLSGAGNQSFELEVALGAAVLSAYPESQYNRIPNLKRRTFDFLQAKILEFYLNKPTLKGASLIELYLRPSAKVSELSYLDWCSDLMTAYQASDGGNWTGFDSDAEENAERLAENADQEGIAELALFLEGDEPELNSRDFDFTVALRGDGLASFFELSEMGMSDMNTGLDRQFKLADIYRRAHLKVGRNVDKSLHPKWYEIDGEDGLYFVGLPRFHPIWWIIGSTSISNCCMTPNNVGNTASRSGFWGNRDRSFILVHEPTSTIIGSLQAIGGKLGKNTKGWELIFDGMEFRNPQNSDSKAQAAIVSSVRKGFDDNENIKEWLRWMLPYLPEGGGGYSGYIDYMENDSDVMVPRGETLEIPQGLMVVSDVNSAYRDFAKNDTAYTSTAPVSFAGRDFTGVELESVEFENLNLSYCNFSESTLNEVFFQGCDLRGAIFERASLDYIYFKGANLENASFDRASIDGPVSFAGASSLDGASFEDVANLDSPLAEFPEDFQPPASDPTLSFGSTAGVVEGKEFTGIEYTGEEFLAKVMGTTFESSDFEGTRFFGSVSFTDCVFDIVDFSKCKFESFTFYNCRFEDCDFSSSEFSYVAFDGCTLKDCNFDTAKMRAVSFRASTELRNCLFNEADLWSVSFDNVKVSESDFRGAKVFFKVRESSFSPNVTFDEETTFSPPDFTQEMFEALGAELM